MPKHIVITGASRGIGYAIADILAQGDHKLTLIASKLTSFHDKHPSIGYFAADFSSFDSIDIVSDQIISQLEHVDVLINNIGMYTGKTLADTEKEDIQHQMNVNFCGPAYFTHRMLPLLRKGTHPQIINISSIAAKTALPGVSAYAASKAAVTGFSNSLRAELNPEGIRVSVLHLSGVNTWNDPNPQSLLAPDDIAKTIQFMVNADSRYQIDDMTIRAV